MLTPSKESEAEIHRLAFFDQLTGLPNRHLLINRLQQALATTERDLQKADIAQSTETIKYFVVDPLKLTTPRGNIFCFSVQ